MMINLLLAVVGLVALYVAVLVLGAVVMALCGVKA